MFLVSGSTILQIVLIAVGCVAIVLALYFTHKHRVIASVFLTLLALLFGYFLLYHFIGFGFGYEMTCNSIVMGYDADDYEEIDIGNNTKIYVKNDYLGDWFAVKKLGIFTYRSYGVASGVYGMDYKSIGIYYGQTFNVKLNVYKGSDSNDKTTYVYVMTILESEANTLDVTTKLIPTNVTFTDNATKTVTSVSAKGTYVFTYDKLLNDTNVKINGNSLYEK